MAKTSTSFKPGQSGNPNGRPSNVNTFSNTARELLAADEINITWSLNGKPKTLNVKGNKDFYHGLVAALIMEGLKGNVQAIRELVDRTEGKPLQTIITSEVNELDNLTDAELKRKNRSLRAALRIGTGNKKAAASKASKKKPA